MRQFILLAVLIAFIPAAVWADCGGCGKSVSKCSTGCAKSVSKCDNCNMCKPKCENKCNTCKPKCENTCKPKCENTCKPKCENTCKPKCENTCKPKCENTCKPKCENTCKPKCENTCKPKCENKCDTGCAKSKCGSKCESKCGSKCENKCNSCTTAPACPKPCACDAWMPYCGCEMVKSLCISITTACDGGTAGPLKLLIRNPMFQKLVEIEIPGPIGDDYTYTYTFDAPVKASDLFEAVLINDTEDAATVTSIRVTGMDECFSYVFIDHICPGMVLGPGGCPRVVMY